MNSDIEKVIYDEKQIEEAASRLGQELTKDYDGKCPMVICVLTGAVLFTCDVVRKMPIYLDMDFMDVSSYKGGTSSTGTVELIRDIDHSVKDRNVLFVEDIVDTGRTLKFLEDIIKDRGAKSIKVCTMFDKPENRVEDVKADYVGLEVPNEFLVGYGLDYDGKYRNLPYIGVLKPEVYSN